MDQRSRLVVNIGNLIELAAVVALVWGVGLLAGRGWAFVTGGVLGILAAEFVYTDHAARLPLPRLPKVLRRKQRSGP